MPIEIQVLVYDRHGTPVSSINKTERHNITEILLKVALNTIAPSPNIFVKSFYGNISQVMSTYTPQ
jgi:hypothetical protein